MVKSSDCEQFNSRSIRLAKRGMREKNPKIKATAEISEAIPPVSFFFSVNFVRALHGSSALCCSRWHHYFYYGLNFPYASRNHSIMPWYFYGFYNVQTKLTETVSKVTMLFVTILRRWFKQLKNRTVSEIHRTVWLKTDTVTYILYKFGLRTLLCTQNHTTNLPWTK